MASKKQRRTLLRWTGHADFVNPFEVPLEATYVFPLPDRGAVAGMRMTAGGRVVEAELQERETARQTYDDAIAAGRSSEPI